MQKHLQTVSPTVSPVVSARENRADTPCAKSAPVELNAAQLKQVGGGQSTGSTAGPNGTW